MKKPDLLTGDYWRGEWAGLKAAKYHLVFLFIASWSMQNSIRNNGFIQLRIPGTEYAVYYFGFDPAIWGFLVGVFFVFGLGKARSAAKQRRKQLLDKRFHLTEYTAFKGEVDPTSGG